MNGHSPLLDSANLYEILVKLHPIATLRRIMSMTIPRTRSVSSLLSGKGAAEVRMSCLVPASSWEAQLNTYFEDAPTMEYPDVEQLARDGWEVLSESGPYFTVWRDGEELLLVWKNGRWRRLGGGGFDNS